MRCARWSIVCLISLLHVATVELAALSDRAGSEVWRIREKTEEAMALAERHALDEWVELNQPQQYVDIMVNLEKKESFRQALREANVDYDTMISDVGRIIKRHIINKRSMFFGKRESESYDYLQYNDWETIEKELKRIARERSDIAKLEAIGTTYEGRSVYVLRVTKDITDSITKPVVLIDAGIHAREWVSVSTIMYIINEVVANPSDDILIKGFLDSFDFVFMPVLNPDGYSYTWTDDRLWRKNRAPNNQSECIGVDLNRNWDFMWGGEGTSSNECMNDFRGYAPFSENETIAVKEWIEQHRHKIVLYINFHAYGQLWMTPYGYSRDRPSNEAEMMHYSEIATEAIKSVRGTTYDYGPVYTTIYPASSISVDWVRGAEKILIAYTVELPDKGLHGFLTDESEIGPIGKETWYGIEQLLLALSLDKKLLRTEELVIV